MRNTRVWLCLLLVCFFLLTVLCVGCAKTPDEPDHSDAPPTVTTTMDGEFETEIIVPDEDDIVTTTTLGYTTGTGVDASTAHVTVTTDDGEAVTNADGTPETSYVSTTTTTTTTTQSTTTTAGEDESTTTTKSEVKLPFVPFD